MEVTRQGPKEVVPDAYEEYIRARREENEAEKIATVSLPQAHMRAIALLIVDALEDQGEPLTASQQRVWDSIVRALTRAVQEAG